VEVHVEKAPKAGRKAKGDGYLRRAEILDAAEKLFVREGYQGATIRKIAQEVGLSSTALYMHFRDKSEILVEICENAFRELRATNQQIAELSLPPMELARRMLHAYIHFALANPNAYVVVFERSAEISPEKQAALNALGEAAGEPFNQVLRELSQTTPLRCEVAEAANVCWAACHGLVSLMINHPKMPWASPPAVITDLMVDTLLNGLKAT
jgi:AcrR family transcriptional regulator